MRARNKTFDDANEQYKRYKDATPPKGAAERFFLLIVPFCTFLRTGGGPPGVLFY